MFSFRYMPCTECGDSVDRRSAVDHECDPERLLDYRMFHLREEVEALEPDFTRFLRSKAGEFEQWAAARHVRRIGPA